MTGTRPRVKHELTNTDFSTNEVNNDTSEMESFATPPQVRGLPVPDSGSTIHADDDFGMLNGSDGESAEDQNEDTTSPPPPDDATATFVMPRTLIKTIQKLEALGIDSALPSLPKIVVAGDQSHGKSSVIEAICDISLPRSSGTCTRCPFELVTTTSDGEWSCKVSLVSKYAYSTAPNTPTWPKLITPEIKVFDMVTDQCDLERVLRLAQIAVLSPHKDPNGIRKANNMEQQPDVSFSPNIIRLEIASPKLPELSLYDLPGTINVVEDPKDQHLVDFVDRLLKTYVKEDKAIVLLAVATNVDVENCKAFSLIRGDNMNNAPDRCIGVITKPDLVDRAGLARAKSMLSGGKWRLRHGWYVTKQLSQDDLDSGTITHENAREAEKHFFAGEPWSELPFTDRFGIWNLQSALSQKLTAHILDCLPQISLRIDNKLREVTHELSGFPEKSGAPCIEVHSAVGDVVQCVAKNIKGGRLENGFRDEYRRILDELRKDFKAARPQLTLVSPDFKAPAYGVGDSDDETPEASPCPTPAPTSQSAKARKGENGVAIRTQPRSGGRNLPHKGAKPEGDGAVTGPTIFTLAQVRDAYKSGNRAGLPGGLSPEVTDALSLRCLAAVRSIFKKALDGIEQLIAQNLQHFVQTTLSIRQGTKLYRQVQAIVHTVFTGLFKTEKKAINDDVARELHLPILTDEENFRAKKEAKHAFLFKARTLRRVNEYFDHDDAKKSDSKKTRFTTREDRKKRAEDQKWVDSTLGPDVEKDMIEAMVVPLAYYEIACARMQSNLTMKLEFGLMRPLEQELGLKLLEGLHYTVPEYCSELLAEDAAREHRRQELLVEMEKLQRAMDELNNCRNTTEV